MGGVSHTAVLLPLPGGALGVGVGRVCWEAVRDLGEPDLAPAGWVWPHTEPVSLSFCTCPEGNATVFLALGLQALAW